MEGNLNNNEVNTNQLPNNNYYEPKKNGVKILLIVIIILLLVGIGLLSYKVFVLDKKEPDKTNESSKVEEKEEQKLVSVNINDAEVKKYYNYVSFDHESGTVNEYDYNRIANNKNYFAYTKLIVSSSLKEEKCSTYASYIEKNSPNPEFVHRCKTFNDDGEGCSSEYNKRTNTKVVVLEEKTLKEAVELIYGKGTYIAGKFAIGGSDYFGYVSDESKYILLTACGGGTGPWYTSKLSKAEKSSSELYIYEELTDNSNEFDENTNNNEKLIVKHTFEKNTYDNNYHYVKSEKGE